MDPSDTQPAPPDPPRGADPDEVATAGRSAAAPRPPDPGAAVPAPVRPPRLGWHPLWKVLGAVLVLTLVAAIGGSFIRAPYLVYAPGSAIATQPAVEAPGTEVHESEGDVLFLTVSLRGASRRIGFAEALVGWLHPDQDVFPRRAILGDQTGRENREEAAQEMSASQEVAAKVALEHLGYEVPVRGTGVLISGTIEGTPAAAVLEPGDAVVELDGEPIDTDVELRQAIAPRAAGDVVEVVVERGEDRERVAVDVELTSDPEDPSRTLLGVVNVATRDLSFDLPFPIEVDTRDVGGPSAGLALTLGILDVLTPGSLTGGHDVAVTGTIGLDGSVGQVGGIGQKTVAAVDAGADLILVPEGEAALAEDAAGDVEVVGVASLDDALAALARIGGNALELDRSGG